VPHALVPPVPPLGVLRVELFHGARNIRSDRSDLEVVVVRHDAVVPALDAEFLDDIAEEEHEVAIVLVVQKDRHLAISTRHDVPEHTG
jgi:hypothetical protein